MLEHYKSVNCFANNFSPPHLLVTVERNCLIIKNIYMKNLTKSKTAKLVAGFVGLTMAFAMVATPAFADSARFAGYNQ